jgi:hypothetical protein
MGTPAYVNTYGWVRSVTSRDATSVHSNNRREYVAG